jgi:hypothetical protein
MEDRYKRPAGVPVAQSMNASFPSAKEGGRVFRHTRVVQGLAAALVVIASASLPASSAAQSSCRPADATSARTVTDLQDLVTSSDSFTVRTRTSLGLPVTAANKVSYATDTRTCNSAVTALNGYFATPNRARTVYVYKVGSYYAVEDPGEQQSQAYRGVIIYDSKWGFKGAWGPN